MDEEAATRQLNSQLKTPAKLDLPKLPIAPQRTYQELNRQINQYRLRLPKTSDAAINLAQEQTTEERMNYLRERALDQLSTKYDDFNESLWKLKNQHELDERTIGDHNWSVGELKKAASISSRATAQAGMNNNLQKALAEMREKLSQDRKIQGILDSQENRAQVTLYMDEMRKV